MYGEMFYDRHTAQHQLQWRHKKKRSLKSNENIRKKDRSYYLISANKTSSAWPVMTRQRKPGETYCNFANFKWAVGS